MIKLINLLNEISINLENSYLYTLSKNKNIYVAKFITENQTEYEYKGTIKGGRVLGINFEIINKPGVKQDIEKTEKNLKEIWLQIPIGKENHTKDLFDFQTKTGILNVNDIKWNDLYIPINQRKSILNYVKSNFSPFNNKYIDLNKLSSYNINGLFIRVSNIAIKGFKITSGEQEIIISPNPEYGFLEIYYKLDLDKLNEKLLDYIKPYIKSFSSSQHVGTHITTNEKNTFKIMNTIFKITKEIFDSNNKIEYLAFTPALTSKEENINNLDQSKRSKLYKLYINQFYPGSYKVTGDELEDLPYYTERITYKINKKNPIYEVNQCIKEIGDASSTPYISSDALSLDIKKSGHFNVVTGKFTTDNGLTIKYEFRGVDPEIYGFEFMIDEAPQHSIKSTPKEYLRIMSSIVLIVNKFLSENNISELWISGADKSGFEGQKNKIYIKYVESSLKNNSKYFLKHDGDDLIIMKK
jgi:hypothetical protein